jgi:hypothetical protein
VAGPFTATIEVAGPFRIEGKQYTIVASQALASDDQEPAKSHIGLAIVVLGIIAVVAAGLVIYKEKAAA